MPAEHEVRTRVSYDHESDEPRGRRRPVADWGVGEDVFDRLPSRRFTRADRRDEGAGDRRPAESWFEPEGAGESRTIVIETSEPVPEEPPPRRTVVISGHPDRLRVARASRPRRTAIDRIGTSPDRIVAYAVALGFLLILIAALTTGQ
jgi:hypothetical protein